MPMLFLFICVQVGNVQVREELIIKWKHWKRDAWEDYLFLQVLLQLAR